MFGTVTVPSYFTGTVKKVIQVKDHHPHVKKLHFRGATAIEEAVADWFYERKPVRLIDSKHGLPHWCTNDPHEPSPKNHYKWGQ
ncbi:hypothetical protein LguiB_008754 [Lonicera macranthoides]